MRNAGSSLVLSLLFSSALSGSAYAGERELILAVEPGLGSLAKPDEDLHFGFQSSVSAWIGLTGTIWLAGSLGFSHPGTSQPDSSFEAVAGLVAALDVFQVVPYAELMAGGLWANDRTVADLRLGLGADYLLTESLWLGVVLRYRPLPDEIGSALTSFSGRLAYRFDL